MQNNKQHLLQFSQLRAKKLKIDHLQFLLTLDHGIVIKRLQSELCASDFRQFILDYFPQKRIQDVALYLLLADNIEYLQSCNTPWDALTVQSAIVELNLLNNTSTNLTAIKSKVNFLSSLQSYEVSFLIPAEDVSICLKRSGDFHLMWEKHIGAILHTRALTDLSTLSSN